MRRFRRLLRHAVDSVPFYAGFYAQHGIEPGHVKERGDLQRLPVLQRSDLRELAQQVPDKDSLFSHKTSGSVGTPVEIFRTPHEERRLNLFRWRQQVMCGLRPGFRTAKVKTVWERLPDRFERLARLSARTGLVDRRVFDCLQPPETILEQLLDFQPHTLSCYPATLVKIALRYDKSERRLENLRHVSTGGEYLAPHQRRVIERSFDRPVIDTYGSIECNLAAWQCARTGAYHLCDDNVLLEICRDGVPVEPGEEGDVIISVLHSRRMPIIRYALGDRAVAGASPCSCGAPFSTLQGLRGRVMDYLVNPDGSPLHPLRVVNELIVEAFDWIAEYQLVQESADRFRLQIVPLRGISGDEQQALHEALQRQLAEGVHLEIEQVESIAAGKNGKFRFCRSAA